MSAERAGAEDSALREVVIGKNSRVWKAVSRNPAVAARFAACIGHGEVQTFQFRGEDRVWVFAYSRVARENSRLFDALARAAVKEVVYVSSATTIVTTLTRCYAYPRVKKQAEEEAKRRLNARILTLGVVTERIEELPSGRIAATPLSRIEAFVLAPYWGAADRTSLFEIADVPFATEWEARLHRAYDSVQWLVRRWPCALRPVDVMLRAMGLRWYGYVNLSNRLWTTTTY